MELFLELGGIQVGAPLRTLTYLRRGLAGKASLTVGMRPDKATECGYADIYSDTYCADLFDPYNLACFCEELTGVFVSPAADPAPWYDAARPESAEFLGFVPTAITILAAARHEVTPRAPGGGQVSSLRTTPRIVPVEGALFASSSAGMEYGKRWLISALTGRCRSDADCDTDELRLLFACESSMWRTLKDTALIDGPTFNPLTNSGCVIEHVAFQLGSGTPELLLDATAVFQWGSPGVGVLGPTTCGNLVGPDLVGDAAALITIHAGTGTALTGIVIAATGAITFSMTIASLPSGSMMVIDASNRTITVTDSAGAILGGMDYITFTGAFKWLVACPGDTVNICVSHASGISNATSYVEVERVVREL